MSFRQMQFEALVRAHSGDLFRVAWWLCKDRDVAEDLVQETLLRAWRNIAHLRDADAARPWLMTILRREHARLYERKRLEMDDSEDAMEHVPDELPGPADWGTQAQVREALASLEPKYREPLVLQVLGGLSCEEIAAELGLGRAAVMTQLFRARRKLMGLLGMAPVEARRGLS